MRKIRVLLLLHELTRTGAPKLALDAVGQMGRELDIRTISQHGGPLLDRARDLGLVDILGDLPSAARTTTRLLRRIADGWLAQSVDAWRPDVIYANSVVSVPILQKLRLPPVPVLLHVHEVGCSLRFCMSEYGQPAHGRVQHYIAVCEAVRDDLVQEHGVDPGNITVIHNFIRMSDGYDRYAPSTPDPSRPFVVGGAGAVTWTKGGVLWLQVAAELADLMPGRPLRFRWVGAGDDWPNGMQFREMARKLGVEALVDFVPPTPEPLPHFATFDVLAVTSWEESGPLVALESMMLATPVLCFAGSRGAPEEVGDAGLVVPRFSPRAMALAIAELAADPRRTAMLGQAGRDRVAACFSDAVQVPKICAVVRSLAEGNLRQPVGPLHAG